MLYEELTLDAVLFETRQQNILDFLKLVHPFLAEDTYHKGCVSIQALSRDKSAYCRPCTLWRADDTGKAALQTFLEAINGKAFCVYWSVFCFDYHFKANGTGKRTYKSGYVNNQNAIYTTILPIDFDNISYDHYKEYLTLLEAVGIDATSMFTGNGYQTLIHLNETVYDKTILSRFTMLLLEKGFAVDPSIAEASQIMRMPWTFNCKEYDPKKKEALAGRAPQGKPTSLLHTASNRYSVQDVFDRVEAIKPIGGKVISIAKKLESKAQQENKGAKLPDSSEEQMLGDSNCTEAVERTPPNLAELGKVYDMIKLETLPTAVVNMLHFTDEPYRNKVLLFLVPFLKRMGMKQELIPEVMQKWGLRCDPRLEEDFVRSEVKRLLEYDSGYCYKDELKWRFGYINFDEYKWYNKIPVKNKLFNHMGSLPDAAVMIYLKLILYEKKHGVKLFTLEDISRITEVSKTTLGRNIPSLVRLGFLDKKRACKKAGNSYSYHLNLYYENTKGYTLVKVELLERMVGIEGLTNAEAKVCLYLHHMFGKNNYCWPSQSTLAENTGLSRSAVSKITDSLAKRGYIQKQTLKKHIGSYCLYYPRRRASKQNEP